MQTKRQHNIVLNRYVRQKASQNQVAKSLVCEISIQETPKNKPFFDSCTGILVHVHISILCSQMPQPEENKNMFVQ
jgi:hypothetical protein